MQAITFVLLVLMLKPLFHYMKTIQTSQGLNTCRFALNSLHFMFSIHAYTMIGVLLVWAFYRSNPEMDVTLGLDILGKVSFQTVCYGAIHI